MHDISHQQLILTLLLPGNENQISVQTENFAGHGKPPVRIFFLGCNEEKLIFASWMPTKIVVAYCHPPSSKQKSNRSMHYLNCNTSNLTPDACFPLRSHTPASRFTLVIDSQLNQTYLLPFKFACTCPALTRAYSISIKIGGNYINRTLRPNIDRFCAGCL